jgi:ribosomal protein L11 methyltransferase
MNFIQLKIKALEAEQENLIAVLSELESIGFEQKENVLLVYFNESDFDEDETKLLLKNIPLEISTVPQQNWNELWENNFEPVVVENFCAVRADFHPPISNVKHEIIITPKMSFGTGHHSTTFLMIKQMKAIDFLNRSVFDFGTGTGILAILAEKCGAASISAVDIDEWSLNNATENVANNNCFKVKLSQADSVPKEQFDVLLVNINKNVILLNVLDLVNACSSNGKILLSGFLVQDEHDIRSAFEKHNFHLLNREEKSEWICLLLGK